MDAEDLALRRAIFESFAAPARPGEHDPAGLRRLAAQHVVVLDDHDRVLMAHPFAAHREGARVDSGDRTWWGSCAWDGFGIAAALGLRDAEITSGEVTVRLRDGEPLDEARFSVEVPARHWWDDIVHT